VTPATPVTPVVPAAPIVPAPLPGAPEADPEPVVPTPTPTEPEELVDEPVPTAQLPDEDVPQANSAAGGEWALVNLILTILTAIASVVLWALYFVNKRKEDEEEDEYLKANAEDDKEQELNRHGIWRIASIVPAIAAIVAFILTEDMTLRMVMVDKWTILMAIIALVQVAIIFLAKKKVDDQEPDEDDGFAVKA
jgi:hypothetical protein